MNGSNERLMLRVIVLVVVIVAGIWARVFGQAQSASSSISQLYENHRWFELRSATVGQKVPDLYSGAVAAAFDEVADAENLFRRATRDASHQTAVAAYEALLNLYIRQGRSRQLLRLLHEAVQAAPDREDFQNAATLFAPLLGSPDQSVAQRSNRWFHCDVSPAGIYLPGSVNSKPVEWLFDSDFSNPAISEREATRLGVPSGQATARAGDYPGGTSATRAAVLRQIRIGGTEFRNIPVLVFPDSQPPWSEMSPDRQGIFGIPVALAAEGIEWTKRGECRLGSVSKGKSMLASNLALDEASPVTLAQINGKSLELVVDTGNQGGSQLWRRFDQEFPEIAERGLKMPRRVSQISGSVSLNILAISELRFSLGGFQAVLRPANLFPTGIGNDFQHGILGMDVWSQASDVTLDFKSMLLIAR